MRFYVAAKYDWRISAMYVADVLRSQGHEVQAEWLDGTHSGRSPEQQRQYAEADLRDIQACDMFILLQFPMDGTPPQHSAGRHIELGYAMGIGKPCLVVGGGESVFFSMVARVASINELAKYVEAL